MLVPFSKKKNKNVFHAWQNSRTESQTAQPASLEIGQPMKSHYPPTSDFSCVYLVPQFNDWSGGKVQGVQLVTSHRLSADLLPQTFGSSRPSDSRSAILAKWGETSFFPDTDEMMPGVTCLFCLAIMRFLFHPGWHGRLKTGFWVSKTGWDTPATPHPNAQN